MVTLPFVGFPEFYLRFVVSKPDRLSGLGADEEQALDAIALVRLEPLKPLLPSCGNGFLRLSRLVITFRSLLASKYTRPPPAP